MVSSTYPRSMRRVAAAAALVALALGACSGGSEVGSEVRLGKGTGSGALRDPTETTAPDAGPVTTTPPGGGPGEVAVTSPTAPAPTTPRVERRSSPANVPTTARPATRRTTTTQAATDEYVIEVQDDQQGNFVEPLRMEVPSGATVTWRNVGTKTYRVLADNGLFASDPLAPGQSWSWVANVPPQTIQYREESRPYARAELIVV